MNDSMVTARMSRAKKEAGGRVLSKLGSNASQLINDVYDYLIANNASPCENEGRIESTPINRARIAEALVSIEGLCLPQENRFATMDDAAIKRDRLSRRGLIEE